MIDYKIKLITYNIDGLPEKLDLNDLPWYLKPITWIYKLIKKTTIVPINDNANKNECIKQISKCLNKETADIISVQEDFNYHDELISCLNKNHITGTYTGSFDLKNFSKNVEWLSYFPLPRFKADGLNIIAKNNRIKINEEKIVNWKKSNGYFGHANDLLTHKGFRFYNLTIDNIYDLDLYIVHMDADFYHPEKCTNVNKDVNARKSQLEQLSNYIIERFNKGNNNPIIITGDTNSTYKYGWDIININHYLINKINDIECLHIKEAVSADHEDVDKLFYINNDNAIYKLKLDNCYYAKNYDTDKLHVSDHKPFITNFYLEKRIN